MSRFGKAIEKIAIKAAQNGGPDTQDILTAMVAAHDDSIESAELTAAELKRHRLHNEEAHQLIICTIADDTAKTREVLKDTMAAHMEWAESNLRRLEVVEKLQLQQTDDHLRSKDDPPDSQFTEQRESAFPETERTMQEVLLGWRFSKWLVGLIIVVAVGWVLPFWANSCATQNLERVDEPEPAHTLAP